jgi:phage I-like protein
VLIKNAKDNKTGNQIGWTLHSVALTNTPFFTELKPIAAKQNQNKESKVSKEELEKLKTENVKLKEQVQNLDKELQKAKEIAAKQKVKDAIAAKKINKSQEEWALKYALTDGNGFEDFLKNAKPLVEVPESNQFAASSKPEIDTNIEIDRI